MADGCPLCVFILDRLEELHTRSPREPAFSSYTIIEDGPEMEAPPVTHELTPRDLDIHLGRHLRREILVVQSCCTARTYRLASLGPATAICAV